jgi:hypothetical protein
MLCIDSMLITVRSIAGAGFRASLCCIMLYKQKSGFLVLYFSQINLNCRFVSLEKMVSMVELVT